jgi:adenosylmethionine-8-amino-7-oxononanoate aminotransferase
VASRKIFDAFWSDDPAHALMHGPTYMGNALACAAANASLDLFESEPRLAQAARISGLLDAGLAPCGGLPGVADVRVMGAIGVVEFEREPDRRALQRALIARGVWVRPFGKIVYLTPALTISEDELATLTTSIVAALRERNFAAG